MFQKITRRKLDKFLKEHASDEKVLDIGSGGSRYDKFFPHRFTVDIDPERKPKMIADVHSLPFKEAEFETILCTEVLEHTHTPQQAIDELYRVLKPGGTLLLTTRFVYPLHDAPGDYWRFTRFGLLRLFSKWEVVKLQAETQSFSALGALIQRMCFQSDLRFNKVIKFFLFLLAWIFDHVNFLIQKEYGDIKREQGSEDIMTTGYYVVAKKL